MVDVYRIAHARAALNEAQRSGDKTEELKATSLLIQLVAEDLDRERGFP